MVYFHVARRAAFVVFGTNFAVQTEIYNNRSLSQQWKATGTLW